MENVPHKSDPDDFRQWLGRKNTIKLLQAENDWLSHWVRRYYGLHMMYAGVSATPDFYSVSPARHKFRFGVEWQRNVIEADAWVNSSHWPLADQSVDIVVLQHALDFTRRPHQMLREAARVVVPNGYVVIVGFNPWSAWGALQKLMPFSSSMPWTANSVSKGRLTDWLTLLDLRTEVMSAIAHVWPWNFLPENLTRRINSVLAGNAWLPGPVYGVVARKTVAGVTPIRRRGWRVADQEIGWAASRVDGV